MLTGITSWDKAIGGNEGWRRSTWLVGDGGIQEVEAEARSWYGTESETVGSDLEERKEGEDPQYAYLLLWQG